ncbi:putative DsbA family dithiol-disulfide isomerase [Neorhizobium galegae]|uniref:hypothetical protein n=1 Tax=Neorhizobium galegae TaxID=399 RepID=UPI001AE93533|nr:hypothetical protein [Neorhizobium galegae]MBP2560073.1 putative DsbA family dithiol-disulfide isomerase [Neorhizobium galegae]
MIDWIFSEDDIILTETEAKAIEAILASDCRDPVKTVLEAGYNPSSFFEHGNWEGIDFRRSNVDGVSFDGAILTSAIFDRSQFDLVSKTNPRTIDKVHIYEVYGAEDEPHITILQDKPLDSGEAAHDFRYVLKKILTQGGPTKGDWAILTAFSRRLTAPRGRRWALNHLLENFSGQVSNIFLEFCGEENKSPIEDETTADLLIKISKINDGYEIIKYIASLHKLDRLHGSIITKAASLIKGMDEFRQFIKVAKFDGWELSQYAISLSAINVCKNIEDARVFLEILEEVGNKPAPIVFSRLAQSSKSMDGVRELLAMMKEAGVQPDPTVFSKLADSSKSMDGVRELLAMMKGAGVQPDPTIFSRLAESTRSMDGVRELLAMMKEAGVKPDPTVFSKLAESTKSMDGVRELLAMMKEAEVQPDPTVFSKLAESTKSMEGVRELLAMMKEAGVKPDGRHYKTFIGCCRSVEEAQAFLKAIDEENGKQSITSFDRMLSNSESADKAEEIWNLYAKYCLTQSHISFTIFLRKLEPWELAWENYRTRRPPRVIVTINMFNSLLLKSRNRTQLKKVFDEMTKRRITADEFSLTSILGSALSDRDVIWALSNVEAFGLDISRIQPETLGDQAERYRRITSRT